MADPEIDFVAWLGESLLAWEAGGPQATEEVLMRHPAKAASRLVALTTLTGARVIDRSESGFGYSTGGPGPQGDLPAQAKDDAIELLQLRGGSRCCYCGRRLVARLVHALIATQFEGYELWPTGWSWDASHPGLWTVWPALEHVWPKARGGHMRDGRNLAVACWDCNEAKSDIFIEEIRDAGFDWSKPQVSMVRPVGKGWD